MMFKTKFNMSRYIKYFCLVGMLIFIFNCSTPNRSSTAVTGVNYPVDLSAVRINGDRVKALEDNLTALNHHYDNGEARQIAVTALRASVFLSEEYRLVRPPILHNLLVQIGLRDRGLCYHWTEDLMYLLGTIELKNYQLRWGVAYRGSDWREHNTVVITADGQSFENGLVLDPWRYSGELYWVVVKDDRYPWKELPREKW